MSCKAFDFNLSTLHFILYQAYKFKLTTPNLKTSIILKTNFKWLVFLFFLKNHLVHEESMVKVLNIHLFRFRCKSHFTNIGLSN